MKGHLLNNRRLENTIFQMHPYTFNVTLDHEVKRRNRRLAVYVSIQSTFLFKFV